MEDKYKKAIDDMPYHEMFALRRFAPIGHKYFLDDTGQYFMDVMAKKEKHITAEERVRISKDIGWG